MASEALAALRRRIEALERGGPAGAAPPGSVLPFGVAAVDGALPGGGLALGALHELRGAGSDEEDAALAAGFLAGILARLGMPRPVLWCLAGEDLYGPGLAACGLAPERLVLARARNDGEVLWAMEEGLRSPSLAAVVGEVGALTDRASRRLQLAAAATGVTAFVLRRWRSGEAAAAQRALPNAATTRWRVTAAPSAVTGEDAVGEDVVGEDVAGEDAMDEEPGVGHPRWRVELMRCRGGVPASWMMEACDATGHVSLAAGLVDRPARPARPVPATPSGPPSSLPGLAALPGIDRAAG